MLADYQTEQRALRQEERSLIDGGATPEQLQAWREQNAPRYNAQQERARNMALQSALDYMPLPGQATIPTDASPTLAALLKTRATLANAQAQIHNRLVQALPADVAADDIIQMQKQEIELVEQQLGRKFAAQARRAQALAEESAAQITPLPPPSQIPADATPQMRAFLAARDQFMRAEITVRNRYAGTDAATRHTALQQWRQLNVPVFGNLQKLAQALAENQ